MNTSALVDRLNFASQLTSGKFAGQRFDAARVVALGLLSEGAGTTAANASADASAGTEIALRVLEGTLVGGDVSAKTNELIHQQIAQAEEQGTAPGDMLNLLTALVMGSPEFQVR
jgi:hypothetical protein